MPIAEAETQRQLAKYLAGDMSLTDLHHWLSEGIANSTQWADPAVERLAMRLMNLLSVHTAGGWTEDELKAELRPLMSVQWLDVTDGPVYRQRPFAATDVEEQRLTG